MSEQHKGKCQCQFCLSAAVIRERDEVIRTGRVRIAELEAEVGALSAELLAERAKTAAARREALEAAADRMLRDFREAILFSPIGDSFDAGVEIAKELRRMAREVKP